MSDLPTVERSVLIRARVGQIWDALTTPRLIAEWANTFQAGMYAESAWLRGCEVLWKSAEGEVMLKGRVAHAKRGEMLKIDFDRTLNPGMPEGALAFSECYSLRPEGDAVRLSLVCGPMPPDEFQLLDRRWGVALDAIRQIAEAGGAARMGRRLAARGEPSRHAHG